MIGNDNMALTDGLLWALSVFLWIVRGRRGLRSKVDGGRFGWGWCRGGRVWGDWIGLGGRVVGVVGEFGEAVFDGLLGVGCVEVDGC